MDNKNKLAELINKLPIALSEKQDLLGKLEAGKESAVKAGIKKILSETAKQLKASQDLSSATRSFDAELGEIEKQAGELVKSVAKDQTDSDLEKLRKDINL